MLKISLLFKKNTDLWVNNLKILMIKNAKLLGCYFYMNLNIWADFQICISVPLRGISRRSCFDFLSHPSCSLPVGPKKS